MRSSLLLVLALSATTFGCSKKTQETSAGAPTESSAKPTSDHAADDKATEDLQARAAEQTKAAEAKAATDAEAAKAHAATHDQLQANFDASDRRLNTLKEKALKLTGPKQKAANAAVEVAKTNAAAVMASIGTMREASLAQWDAAKAKVESDTAALNKSIDSLDAAMQ